MKYAVAILCFVLAVGAAQADDAATVLLTPAQVDASRLLPPAPAQDSAQTRAEIAELERIAKERTPEAFAAAARDAKDETGAMFADALGPAFDLAKLPATAKMLADIHTTEEVVSKPAKEFFHRERPWVVDPSLTTCTEHKPGSSPTSYPSGHATIAYAMGAILASLVPDKAQAILARSSQFAENRLVCGVHYRSDIVAGEAFGTVIAVDLMQNALFRSEYDASAAELSTAHLR
jgi:acid phosphatase (class A)